MTRVGRRLALLVVALALGVAPVGAHQYWLFPSRYSLAAGETVEIAAVAGTGFRGDRIHWSPRRCIRFVVRGAITHERCDTPIAGDSTWLRFPIEDAGGTLLAYETNWAAIAMPADSFDLYLADEGLDGPLATRRELHPDPPGRERYRRCARLWLAGTDATRATAPVGMPLEVVPVGPPGASATTRVRVLWQGEPLAGALVQCWRAPLAPGGATADPAARDSARVRARSRTDARGLATLPTAAAGEWMVSVVHMQPCPDRDAADWESTWASFTFARPPGRR